MNIAIVSMFPVEESASHPPPYVIGNAPSMKGQIAQRRQAGPRRRQTSTRERQAGPVDIAVQIRDRAHGLMMVGCSASHSRR